MTAKRIALAEWNWMGHHPTYFAHFVLALEEVGAEVLAICPHPGEARQAVMELRAQRGLAPAREGQTAYRQIATHQRRFQRIRPARIGAIDWTIRHFRSIEALARNWRADSGKRVDLIFYAGIHDWDFDCFHSAQPFLSLPWSGLYIHALSIRAPGALNHITGRAPTPEKIFRGSLCRGVAILDEGIVAQFAAVVGKPVVVFPDLTDERLPAGPDGSMLGRRLKRFAEGRPIVGLFGFLQRSKAVVPLALVSQDPGMAKTCFALGGELVGHSFSTEETACIGEILTNGANMWSHLIRIPKEEQLNSLLSACDVLYAAYLDFPHSSNIMTKAALLQKPLIVSEGYLMAERVRRFKTGEIVPQGDANALMEAIAKITRDPGAWVRENRPRWSDYLREHSFERLKESFRELFAKL